ncbi:hypothetical protein PAXRUDRAFT_20872 [Paxillus rubicundulus Ve08.2h10]|uniref:Uncharacterized protein n=1 Tax=Paxillus rubicundulus Ve08.2h10 TaxID=930991 RepID=A0A0D0CD37_9AGAM|nr:hypothetical protein PAXRUDRAFT_20872 [Paxillus rubicundulus Ve08.2h10]
MEMDQQRELTVVAWNVQAVSSTFFFAAFAASTFSFSTNSTSSALKATQSLGSVTKHA